MNLNLSRRIIQKANHFKVVVVQVGNDLGAMERRISEVLNHSVSSEILNVKQKSGSAESGSRLWNPETLKPT